MPILNSAKKALRQTKKRTLINKAKKAALKTAFKNLSPKSPESLNRLYSLADKLVKNGVIHKNKAKRLKSRATKKL